MRGTVLCVLAIATLAASPAVADKKTTADRPTEIVGKVTEARTGKPIENATVTITLRAGSEQVRTNAHGLYRVVVAGAGRYVVGFEYAGIHDERGVDVAGSTFTIADGQLDVNADEVIVIHDPITPPVPPKPRKDPRIAPKYSDAAVESDAWTKAWLLLDIDERGTVTRVKFLKRPGFDLDKIALETALATKFDPAEDASGHPVRTLMVWPIEWASYWWLVTFEGVVTRIPDYADRVPCAGSGPLHLDSVHPSYRDCSQPDLAKARGEPWVDLTALKKL